MMTLEEISAHLEIRRVLEIYCRGTDRQDVGVRKAAYWPEANDDHGQWVGNAHEFVELRANSLEATPDQYSQHHLTNCLINLDLPNDKAASETYFLAFHPGGTGDPTKMLFAGGRYLDKLERRSGDWKIIDRVVVVDWSREHLLGDTWEQLKTNSAQPGGPDTDPSYGLGLEHV